MGVSRVLVIFSIFCFLCFTFLPYCLSTSAAGLPCASPTPHCRVKKTPFQASGVYRYSYMNSPPLISVFACRNPSTLEHHPMARGVCASPHAEPMSGISRRGSRLMPTEGPFMPVREGDVRYFLYNLCIYITVAKRMLPIFP